MITTKIVLKIQGMICRQCEYIVESAILHTRGVINAKASYWKGKVSVEYDPEIISEDDIKKSLELAGYPAGSGGLSGIIADIICAVCAVGVFLLLPLLKSIEIPKATEGATIGAIFLIGLLTSTHCIAMCGGIMLTQTIDKSFSGSGYGKKSKYGLLSSLYYNGGRVISYSLMGAIFGALWAVLSYTAPLKSMVFTIAGALVIIIGIQMWE